MKYIVDGDCDTQLVVQPADDGLLHITLRYSDESREDECSCAYIEPEKLIELLEKIRPSSDWQILSPSQRSALDDFRLKISTILISETEQFHQKHPDLRLHWSFNCDATKEKD